MAKSPRKNPESCPVEAYARAVIDGQVVAGELIRLACARHVQDLAAGHERGLRWDLAAANHAIAFFGYLKHSKGQWAGEGFQLEPWQKFIVGCLFGWKRADGTRRFRMSYSEIPRKNGKSTLAAGVGLYLLVGDGEPGAEVYTAATKRDQAKIVHSEAVRMVKKSSDLRRFVKINKDNLHVEASESKYEPLGANDDTLDGLNVSGAIVDELHAHRTRALLDVLDTATGSRRQPLIFIITTAGHDQLSVCWAMHEKAERVLRGSEEDDAFFCFVASIDQGDDWTSPAVWAKANPNYGISVKPDDLDRKCRNAQKMPAAQNGFRRLHLDEWTSQETRWIPMALWKSGDSPIDVKKLRGRACWGGLDLASKVDLAAFALAFPFGSTIRLRVRFWIPEEMARAREKDHGTPYSHWAKAGWIELTDGEVLDPGIVQAAIEADSEVYQIGEVAYDPWNCTQAALALAAYGVKMTEFPQTIRNFNEPARLFESLLKEGKLVHGGNPVLSWCAENVSILTDRSGNIRPIKPEHGSPKKVDGIIAAVMALGTATLSDGESVYESRGIQLV